MLGGILITRLGEVCRGSEVVEVCNSLQPKLLFYKVDLDPS